MKDFIMKCPVQFLLVYLSLVVMTAGFVLSLSSWFAPPINHTVLDVRRIAPCIFLSGFILLMLSCVVYVLRQGRCAVLCYTCCPKCVFGVLYNEQDSNNSSRDVIPAHKQQSHTPKIKRKTNAKPVNKTVAKQKDLHALKKSSTESLQEKFSPRKNKLNTFSRVKYQALDLDDHLKQPASINKCDNEADERSRVDEDGGGGGGGLDSSRGSSSMPTSLLCLPRNGTGADDTYVTNPLPVTQPLYLPSTDMSSDYSICKPVELLSCFSFGTKLSNNTVSVDCLPLKNPRGKVDRYGTMRLLSPSHYTLSSPDGVHCTSTPDCYVMKDIVDKGRRRHPTLNHDSYLNSFMSTSVHESTHVPFVSDNPSSISLYDEQFCDLIDDTHDVGITNEKNYDELKSAFNLLDHDQAHSSLAFI